MSKKVKPYGNINRNRTLPNQPSKKNKNNGSNKEKSKNLENTMKIRIDKDKINESELLDTSFLEGRVQGKSNSSKKEKEKFLKEKEEKIKKLRLLKISSFALSFLCIVVLVALIAFNNTSTMNHQSENDSTVVKVIDDNFLFVGDFYTVQMDLKSFSFSSPYVKIAEEGMTTEKVLSDLQHKVYIYNPSVVFLELGTEDLQQGVSVYDILSHYKEIVSEIQENRPNAHIYVESIYPINNKQMDKSNKYYHLKNEDIQSVNEKLKNMASSLHVQYVDLNSVLSEDGSLNKSYSEDGIHLNQNGYKKVWKALKEIVDEEK